MASSDFRSEPEGYRIGTVAGLTGLDPHTIRAWERRHAAVRPARSPRGTRLYDDAAIERLQLLKALVDCGEPIRRLAPLPDATLRERLRQLAGLGLPDEGAARDPAPLRLALLAPAVTAQLGGATRCLAGFRVVVQESRREALVAELRRRACDVLVLELEPLGREPLRALDDCLVASRARLVVILYTFARRGLLTRLARRGARLVRGPLGLAQLERALGDLVASDRAAAYSTPREMAPADAATGEQRRFDDARLARIAEISTAIECECPHHLSSLVRSLVAFESYSLECESRDAEDAAMHRRLAGGTARARSEMEQLLDALCEYEGIDA